MVPGLLSPELLFPGQTLNLLLNKTASAKVQKYREYCSASDFNNAFLPALLSTSGRIHGKFLRLLYILAHRQTVKFFETIGEEPSNEAFTWRRAEYFFHNAEEGGGEGKLV